MANRGEVKRTSVHGDTMELTLPPCSYTATFMAVIGLSTDIKRDGLGKTMCIVLFVVVLPEVLNLVISLVAQLGFTYYIWGAVENTDVCNTHSSLGLKWLGVAAFVGKIMQEYAETFTMSKWFMHAEELDCALEDYENDKITCGTRVLAHVFIVAPKLTIASWLLWLGTRFVLLSDNDTELVLNCLAMTFVCEIDELVFKTASSRLMQVYVKHLKPLHVKAECLTFCDLLLSPVKLALWAGLTALLVETRPEC